MKSLLTALLTLFISFNTQAGNSIQMTDTALLTLVSISNTAWSYDNGKPVSEPRYRAYSQEKTIYAIRLVTDKSIDHRELSDDVLFGDLHRKGNIGYNYGDNDYLVKITANQYNTLERLIKKDHKEKRRAAKVWTLSFGSLSGELLKIIDQEDGTHYLLGM